MNEQEHRIANTVADQLLGMPSATKTLTLPDISAHALSTDDYRDLQDMLAWWRGRVVHPGGGERR